MKFGSLTANSCCIVSVKFCQNQMLVVEVTQMYTRVYLCKTILVTEIFCYRYSTINNFSKK